MECVGFVGNHVYVVFSVGFIRYEEVGVVCVLCIDCYDEVCIFVVSFFFFFEGF